MSHGLVTGLLWWIGQTADEDVQMIYTTTQFVAKRDKRFEILQSLESFARIIRNLNGCRLIQIYKQHGKNSRYLMISAWQDEEALLAFRQSSVFNALSGFNSLLLTQPVTFRCFEHPQTIAKRNVRKRSISHDFRIFLQPGGNT